MAAVNLIPSQCCPPCEDIPVVNIPGPIGAIGEDGVDGVDGVSSFTTTSSAFTMPTEGGVVSVVVANTSWMGVGQVLFVVGGGYMQVSAITNGNIVVLSNLENSSTGAYAANLPIGTIVPSGSKVTPAGIQGPGIGSVFSALNPVDGLYYLWKVTTVDGEVTGYWELAP